MYFLKELGTIIVLGTLFAATAAAPAPAADVALVANSLRTRETDTDHLADVNMYTGTSCNANTYQFTVSGSGSYHCQTVTGSLGANSIQVSARYVDTHQMDLLSLGFLAIYSSPLDRRLNTKVIQWLHHNDLPD